MIYAGLYEVPEDALQMFAVKRIPPNMRPSELRYLYYLTGIISNPPIYPHYKPVTVISVQMQPVPLFTKIRWACVYECNVPKTNVSSVVCCRDGCRPYVELYNESRCVMSTLQEYERMRLFNLTDGKVCYIFVHIIFQLLRILVCVTFKFWRLRRCVHDYLSCP